MSEPEEQPISAARLRALAAAVAFKTQCVKDIVDAGGGIDPLEMLQRLNLLAIEFATLRELVFDIACAEDGGITEEERTGLVDDYYRRLELGITKVIEHNAVKPKIMLATGIKPNGDGREK